MKHSWQDRFLAGLLVIGILASAFPATSQAEIAAFPEIQPQSTVLNKEALSLAPLSRLPALLGRVPSPEVLLSTFNFHSLPPKQRVMAQGLIAQLTVGAMHFISPSIVSAQTFYVLTALTLATTLLNTFAGPTLEVITDLFMNSATALRKSPRAYFFEKLSFRDSDQVFKDESQAGRKHLFHNELFEREKLVAAIMQSDLNRLTPLLSRIKKSFQALPTHGADESLANNLMLFNSHISSALSLCEQLSDQNRSSGIVHPKEFHKWEESLWTMIERQTKLAIEHADAVSKILGPTKAARSQRMRSVFDRLPSDNPLIEKWLPIQNEAKAAAILAEGLHQLSRGEPSGRLCDPRDAILSAHPLILLPAHTVPEIQINPFLLQLALKVLSKAFFLRDAPLIVKEEDGVLRFVLSSPKKIDISEQDEALASSIIHDAGGFFQKKRIKRYGLTIEISLPYHRLPDVTRSNKLGVLDPFEPRTDEPRNAWVDRLRRAIQGEIAAFELSTREKSLHDLVIEWFPPGHYTPATIAAQIHQEYSDFLSEDLKRQDRYSAEGLYSLWQMIFLWEGLSRRLSPNETYSSVSLAGLFSEESTLVSDYASRQIPKGFILEHQGENFSGQGLVLALFKWVAQKGAALSENLAPYFTIGSKKGFVRLRKEDYALAAKSSRREILLKAKWAIRLDAKDTVLIVPINENESADPGSKTLSHSA